MNIITVFSKFLIPNYSLHTAKWEFCFIFTLVTVIHNKYIINQIRLVQQAHTSSYPFFMWPKIQIYALLLHFGIFITYTLRKTIFDELNPGTRQFFCRPLVSGLVSSKKPNTCGSKMILISSHEGFLLYLNPLT